MLTEEDKRHLKSRIDTSIIAHNYKTKKRRRRYLMSVAAVIVVIIGSTIYNSINQDYSEIKNYVDVSKIGIDQSGDVKLVLNKTDEIKITEKASNITYSNSGGEVDINNSKKVTQSSKNKFNTIIVPYGKRTEITLSEGTKVWLNSGSKLTYPVVFNGNKREVHLIGEAIFDVKHNKKQPFYVITNNYDVKVLGTVFNISSYDDDPYTSTALEKGSVEINYEGSSIFGKSKIKITPGTLAVYDSRTKVIHKDKVDVTKYMSWRDGKFIFKNQRMDIIVKKLSRYYNTKIVIESEILKKQTFSGHLNLTDNLGKVLEILKQSTDLSYKKQNEEFIIN